VPAGRMPGARLRGAGQVHLDPVGKPLRPDRSSDRQDEEHDELLRAPEATEPLSSGPYFIARRSSCALIATTTVLPDMRTAPIAGDRTTPHGARTPAASGMANML